MNSIKFGAAAPVLVTLALLSGCGGGDDDQSGSPTAFSVQPAEITVSVAAAVPANPAQPCATGTVGKVYIYGGAPPYTIKVTFDTMIAVSTTQVDNWGGDFTVSYIGGGCFNPGTVIVEDTLKRIVTLKLINKIGT